MPRPSDIAIVCGLGNPGPEYAQTRHNAGFATVDALARREHVTYWKSEAGCSVAVIERAGREILLAKPQDFMNTSGGPLSKLMRERRLKPDQLLVVHDEVDLEQGRLQPKWGGGLNAHNGLRSIANKLGTRDFSRLRFGVGRPPGKMSVADYALRQLKGSFLDDFLLEAEDAADIVGLILDKGMPAALKRYGS